MAIDGGWAMNTARAATCIAGGILALASGMAGAAGGAAPMRVAGVEMAVAAGAPSAALPDAAGGSGNFVGTGVMHAARYGHSATRLADGRVLVTGGNNDEREVLASTELYDPASGTFAPAADGALPRMYHLDHTVLLHDGRVLSMGGCADLGGSNGQFSVCQGVPDAELYDPAAGTWSPTGSMAAPRNLFTATVLQDGRVLVANGSDSNPDDPQWILPAELYDPASGRFQTTGSIGVGRSYTTATLLADGRVLIAGGMTSGATYLAEAEVYDPASGTFAATGPMVTARAGHSASLLPDGRVLIVGGFNRDENVATAEIYDPASGRFGPSTGTPAVARYYHTASSLADGRVLLVGGLHDTVQVAAAELYDPAADRFAPAGELAHGVYFHSATVLQDGRVLVVGGFDAGFLTRADAQLFEPAGDGIFDDGFDG
jgi:hypothetical protein